MFQRVCFPVLLLLSSHSHLLSHTCAALTSSISYLHVYVMYSEKEWLIVTNKLLLTRYSACKTPSLYTCTACLRAKFVARPTACMCGSELPFLASSLCRSLKQLFTLLYSPPGYAPGRKRAFCSLIGYSLCWWLTVPGSHPHPVAFLCNTPCSVQKSDVYNHVLSIPYFPNSGNKSRPSLEARGKLSQLTVSQIEAGSCYALSSAHSIATAVY